MHPSQRCRKSKKEMETKCQLLSKLREQIEKKMKSRRKAEEQVKYGNSTGVEEREKEGEAEALSKCTPKQRYHTWHSGKMRRENLGVWMTKLGFGAASASKGEVCCSFFPFFSFSCFVVHFIPKSLVDYFLVAVVLVRNQVMIDKVADEGTCRLVVRPTRRRRY